MNIAIDRDVVVRAGSIELPGRLTIPARASGIVVFAHGSGSSRLSPRNSYVADLLNEGGLATLLFDLLTPHEETNRVNVFNIELLATRLADAAQWVRAVPQADGLAIGYFGSSTGGAAALWASTVPGGHASALVSRGGRPDLAAPRLPEVTAPSLLIVGALDDVVIDLNRKAQARLNCTNEMAIVPGARHLFEEPGTLDLAAGLARDWFVKYLGRA
jgi:pimeloyl-ACP methyl ester carboxylesterase